VRAKRPRLPDFDYKGTFAYHLILSTHESKPALLESPIAQYAQEQLSEVALLLKFRLLAFCVMSNHLHVLIQGIEPSSDLLKFVQRFKQKTAFHHKQQTGDQLWQQSFYDRVLREDEDLEIVARYIFANPIKAGLVENADEYYALGGKYFGAFADGAKASSLRLDVADASSQRPEAERRRPCRTPAGVTATSAGAMCRRR
jgi:REP element-mobilizing transposase RayT